MISSSLRLFVLIVILLTQKQTESGWWKKDPSYKLWCYEGSRLMIGHDAREDSSECKSIFGVKQYCYRFVAHSPVHDMVKLGCASLMCSPIRNTCAEFEMGGIAGTLCCCNDQSYCNSAPSRPLQWSLLTTFVFFVLPKLCN